MTRFIEFDAQHRRLLGRVRGLLRAGRRTDEPAGSGAAWASRWGWRDAAGIAAGVALTLTISYLFGRRRIFWEDEMCGWMLMRDPTWHHMVRAWKLGADSGGFAFYLTGRAWFRVFGASEVSFRMYSGACFAGAFAVLWQAARRFYSVGVVAFALFNTFFFSPTLVLHMSEGRFYGLLMLSAALAFAVAVAPEGRSRGGRAALCVFAFLAHGLLTTSHLLGVVYSAFFLGAMMVSDRWQGRMRPVLYGSVAAAWLLLLPERAAIAATMQGGKPHFWIAQPSLAHVLGAYVAFSAEIAAVLLVLGVALGFTIWREGEAEVRRLRESMEGHGPVYAVTAALLLVPLAFYVEGIVGSPIFISRYLLPVVIAQAMVTAEATSLIPWRLYSSLTWPDGSVVGRGIRVIGVAGVAAVLMLWVFRKIESQEMGKANYTAAVSAMLPKGIPVLCEDAMNFTELIGQQHGSGVEYMFLLDWPESVRASAPRGEVSEYHIMQSWRRAGYFSGSISDRDEFLRQHAEFFVLHTAAPGAGRDSSLVGNPLLTRFSEDPAYTVEPWASIRRGGVTEGAWLVCRGACAPLGGIGAHGVRGDGGRAPG